MVKALLEITEYENRLLNIVKARHGYRNKSEALAHILEIFDKEHLEPELRPDFVKRMEARQREPTVKVDDLATHLDMNEDV